MRAVVGATAVALVISGCAGGSSAPGATRASTPKPSTRVLAITSNQSAAQGPCGRGGSAAQYTRGIWIWMETRSYSQVLGSSGGPPRLASYARRCGVATAYYAIRHPSLPNYLAAVSGSTGGVTTDCSPTSCPQRRTTIFRQLTARGRQWRAPPRENQAPPAPAAYRRHTPRPHPPLSFPRPRAWWFP